MSLRAIATLLVSLCITSCGLAVGSVDVPKTTTTVPGAESVAPGGGGPSASETVTPRPTTDDPSTSAPAVATTTTTEPPLKHDWCYSLRNVLVDPIENGVDAKIERNQRFLDALDEIEREAPADLRSLAKDMRRGIDPALEAQSGLSEAEIDELIEVFQDENGTKITGILSLATTYCRGDAN